jgi:hypothetical protein
MRKTSRTKRQKQGGAIPHKTCTIDKVYYIGDITNRGANSATVFTVSPSKYQAFGNVLGYKDTVYEFGVTRPLKLINTLTILKTPAEIDADGFINYGDSIDIILLNPENCLNMSYTESNVKNIVETTRAHNDTLIDCV